MALQQQLEQSQRLLLTQTMLQSLEILQMPVSELQSYLEEAALSNPLLDVERPHSNVVGGASGSNPASLNMSLL